MTRLIAIALGLVAASWVAVAHADGASTAGTTPAPKLRAVSISSSELTPPPSAAEQSRGAGPKRLSPYVNEGLYLRMGVGFGASTDVISTTGSQGDRSDVTGMGTAGDVALGLPVTPRLILGGAVWASNMMTANYYRSSGVTIPDSMQHPRDFVMLGPFMDWYFLQSTGLHFEAGLGFSALTGYGWSHGTDRGGMALGGGAMIGFGYDAWVADFWKLGATARLMSAVMAEREAGVTWIHSSTQFPALLLSATYN